MEQAFEKVTNGLYRHRFPGQGPRLLDYARPAKWEALAELPDDALPFRLDEIELGRAGNRTVIRIPCVGNDMLFGLGLQFKTVNQRRHVMHLRADHYTGQDNGRAHAPCPFYVAESGYGVFLDCANEISFYMGTAQGTDVPHKAPILNRNRDKNWEAVPDSQFVEISFDGDSADLYILAGDRPLTAVQRYILLCGGGCLPPLWGLGFWHRTHSLFTAEQVEKEAAEFAENRIPLSVIGLEPGWQSASYPCTFDWDTERFPDPAAFVERMDRQGVKLNLWTHAYISPESGLYPTVKDGCGSHEVWCGRVPDLTQKEICEAYASYFEKNHVALGVSGYKLDECDGFDFYLWPDHASFPSGIPGLQMRQIYALLLQKMTYEIYQRQNRRTYGLVRASNSGSSAYPYVIYSDCYDFREFLTALVNASFIGQLWVPEVREAANADEWVRRFQLVCLSPLAMLDAWYSSLKPWSFPEVTELVRDAVALRESLLPYLYAAFARYHLEGVPPFRSVHLEYALHDLCDANRSQIGRDDYYPTTTTRGVDDQFMLGDHLMVAPMFPNAKQRHVVLPEGNWYDFYTGQYAGSGEVILCEAPLDRIPLYVKDGGLIPYRTGDVLEVRGYGTADGYLDLYADDGESMEFDQGAYRRIRLSVTNGVYTETCLHDGYPDELPRRVYRRMEPGAV